ncbi:MAG: glycosyltransferase family 4 protein [Candidatus Solibacter sp.]|nr:glycosyltransferase family 4 protein [Candidatus Solibacter sp.]
MKIAYVVTRADAVGGASIHVRDLARAMMERGHQATVLLGGYGPVAEQLHAAGVPCISLRWLERRIDPLRDLRALAEMVTVLRTLAPDLVSTHTAKAGWIGRAAARRLGIPALYTPHGWSIGERVSPRLGAIFSLAERAAAKWCAAIICVCEEEKRLALSKGVASAGKLLVVHNGVGDIAGELRARPALAPVRICSVARFASPKDHRTLLTALAALSAQPWELDLVGDGPLEAQTRELASELGLAGRVRFLGYVADPARVLGGAQLFVLSSRSEAFPRSVLEALRAGLPVVASAVGGIGEAVADGASGLLVPAGNPAALAAAVHKLLADAELRERMGAAARASYERRFRLEYMVDSTAAIYVTLLGRTAK